jgi:hypothetical protein
MIAYEKGEKRKQVSLEIKAKCHEQPEQYQIQKKKIANVLV